MKLSPEKFPIDQDLPAICEALKNDSSLVIRAETGAGKTTRLPPYLVAQRMGRVLVLEPRRLAAKLSAARCAETLNSPIGKLVGHHIRQDKKASAETELLFITEGLFLPYIKQDPTLSSFDIIILDEFHERSLHSDTALALIRHLQQTTRPDLKLIVMSATLELQGLSDYLETSSQFDIKGRTFPLHIEYHQTDVAEAVMSMLTDHRCPKNILVFLPGMGEIRKNIDLLKSQVPKNVTLVPLHSSLSPKDQALAFGEQGDSEKKVILTTNIAETSLTVPHITGVIDIGLEMRSGFAPWSGMPLLQLTKISKASATQRAGRAGRIEEGLVYRLYSEVDFGQRENFTPPEVERVDLSHYILSLLDLDIDPQEGLNWYQEPHLGNLQKSLDLLRYIGATEDGRQLSPKGKVMATLSLHPRLSSFLYEEPQPDSLLAACIINEGMVLSHRSEFSEHDDDLCDLALQADLMKSFIFKNSKISDYHHQYLDKKKASRVLELYKMLESEKILKSEKLSPQKTDPGLFKKALLKSFPDRVAKLKSSQKGKKRAHRSYNFSLGRGGQLQRRSVLQSSYPPYIIVLDALEDPKANAAIGTKISAATSVTQDEIMSYGPTSFFSDIKESSFNEKKGTMTISSLTKFGNLVIKEDQRPPVVPRGENLLNLVRENWPWPFESADELTLYHRRVHLLNEAKIEHQCPIFEDDMFDLFLETIIEEETTHTDLIKKGLKSFIHDQLAPQDEYVLDTEAPLEVKLKNGKSFRVIYDTKPLIEARIQDLYSITEHPTIAGSIPLLIHLLSPANRVSQIVSDLPGFWQSSWEQVRKELKARYPKHYWPENPATSEPIRMKKHLT